MNRRGFLKLFGAGLPAVVVAEKIGLIEKATKYFFAPKGGWQPGTLTPGMLRRVMEQMAKSIPIDDMVYMHPSQKVAYERLAFADYVELQSAGHIREVTFSAMTFGGLPVVLDTDVPVGEIHLRRRWNPFREKALTLTPTHYQDFKFEMDEDSVLV